DSNPRTPVEMLLEFQSSAFDHSATSPSGLREPPAHPAARPARSRMIHRHAWGGACFGTLNGGGSSRQGSFFLGGGGAGVCRAGTCRAFAVSGVSRPAGILSGATLCAFI